MYKLAKRQDKLTDPEMIQMLESGDKCFKATIINIFEDLKGKSVLMNKQIEESKQRNENYLKNENCSVEMYLKLIVY